MPAVRGHAAEGAPAYGGGCPVFDRPPQAEYGALLALRASGGSAEGREPVKGELATPMSRGVSWRVERGFNGRVT